MTAIDRGARLWLATRLTLAGRTRSALIVGGNAIGALVLLAATSIPGAQPQPLSLDDKRLAAVVTLALTVPVIALLAAVTRLSASTRDRRLAALRTLGLTPQGTRAVAATETAILALGGILVGIGLFAALAPAISALDTAHGALLHGHPMRPPTWGWLLATAGVLAMSLGVSALPVRQAVREPLASRSQASTPRPRLIRLIPLAIGLAAAGYAASRGLPPDRGIPPRLFVAFLVGTVITAVGLLVAVPVLVRLIGDTLARAHRPSLLIAGRRLQQEPAATARLVSALLIALFVIVGARCVLTAFETTPQAIRAHKALTTGPQKADILAPAGATVDLDALRTATGVRSVTAEPLLQIACQREAICGEALVARCADLPGLLVAVSGCVDGQPQWLVPASFSDAYSNLSAPPTLLGQDNAATAEQQLKLPPVSLRQIIVDSAPPDDPNWGSGLGLTLLVPPSTPGVQSLLQGQRQQFLAVLDGGARPAAALSAAAQKQGADAHRMVVASDWEVVLGYRHLLAVVATVMLSVGLLGLLITAIDYAIERRRHLAALAVVGIPLAVSRRSQLIQAGAPLLAGFPLAGACGLVCGTAYLALEGHRSATPWPAALDAVLLAAAAAMAVAIFTMAGVGAKVRPEHLHRE